MIRIGCFSAFWGDSTLAAAQQLAKEDLDFLVGDYLAEVTMGILAAQRLKGKPGFVQEFVKVVKAIAPKLTKTRIVTNAGGLDPLSCKNALEDLLKTLNLTNIKVSAVYGDDINHPDFQDKLMVAETGEPVREEWLSLNAYLGARGIAQALDQGAHIVVTGRIVDSALVLGPLLHVFKWPITPNTKNDWDKLASASLAGHCIECACHATGGNFTDWRLSAFSPHGGWSNMGYPIVEFEENGSFVVTKPPNTGGCVSIATVAEQLVYEVLDPAAYLLPDVTVDLSQVTLKQVGHDRVLVQGTRGFPPTPWLKVSGIKQKGFKISGTLLIGGLEAAEKAKAVGTHVLSRANKLIKARGFVPFSETLVEVLGAENTFGPNATINQQTREVVLRIAARHDQALPLSILAMELAPAATCMAPGITGDASGRPNPQPCLYHISALVEKTLVKEFVCCGSDGDTLTLSYPKTSSSYVHPATRTRALIKPPLQTGIQVPLIRLCYGRSGDKGDSVNIGLIARHASYYELLKQQVTVEVTSPWLRINYEENGSG